MIDVIIPIANYTNVSSKENLERTIFSILYQDIVNNINIYIVDDGNNKLNIDYKFFSNFVNIKQLNCELNDINFKIQFGIDNSQSDYIMIVNPGDVLFDCFSLKNLLIDATKNNSDMVYSIFIDDNVEHDKDTFLTFAGKLFRRRFIEENNIKIFGDLKNYEMLFISMLEIKNAKFYYSDVKTYIKINRVIIDDAVDYIKCMEKKLQFALDNDVEDEKINELVIQILAYSYNKYVKNMNNNFSFKIIDECRKIQRMVNNSAFCEKKVIEELRNYDCDNIRLSFEQFLDLVDDEKKIDIIIPAYNAHETIRETLLSICLQNIKDKATVYIVDDCSEFSYNNELFLFSKFLNMKQIKMKKNSGPGIVRQVGIENSNNELIIFIDSDDVLLNCFALNNLYKEFNNHVDVTVGIMVDETESSYLTYSNHSGCLHGKMYSRKFIKANNIHFNETRSSEDNSFNQLCMIANPVIKYVNEYIYLYRYNKNSITQSDSEEYYFTSIKWYIYNMVWTIRQGEERNYNKKLISELWLTSYIYVYSKYLELYERSDSNLILTWSKDLEDLSTKYENILSLDEQINIYYNYIYDIIPKYSLAEFRNMVKKLEKTEEFSIA